MPPGCTHVGLGYRRQGGIRLDGLGGLYSDREANLTVTDLPSLQISADAPTCLQGKCFGPSRSQYVPTSRCFWPTYTEVAHVFVRAARDVVRIYTDSVL